MRLVLAFVLAFCLAQGLADARPALTSQGCGHCCSRDADGCAAANCPCVAACVLCAVPAAAHVDPCETLFVRLVEMGRPAFFTGSAEELSYPPPLPPPRAGGSPTILST